MTHLELLTACRSAALAINHAEELVRRLPGSAADAAAIAHLNRLEGEAAPLRRAVWELLLRRCSPRELIILSLYYRQGMTDQQIAVSQSLCRERVRQLRLQALDSIAA